MGEKYVIGKETLDDIADAIREKSGSAGSMTGSAMAGKIRAIELGVKLPALSNPAAAAQIFSGYQAIDGAGQAITGTAGSGITKAATAAKIATGYQALTKTGEMLTGTGTMAEYAVMTGTLDRKATGSITAPGKILLAVMEGGDFAGGTTEAAGEKIMIDYYSSSGSTTNRKFRFSISGKVFSYDGSSNSSSSPATLTYYIVYKV